MQNSTTLQPDTCLSICSALESLLQDSMGPNGLHTTVTTSDDNTLISGDGYTIVTSLMLSHPVARWIVGHLKSHHGKTGDNVKSFILLATEILRHVLHEERGSVTSCDFRHTLTELSFGLAELHSVLPDVVLPKLTKYCITTSMIEQNRQEVEKLCHNLIRTNFAGKFNHRASNHMSQLLCKFILESCAELNKLDETVLYVLDHFGQMFIEVTNEVVLSSRITSGVTISRDFIHKSSTLTSLSTIKFVLLQTSFENLTPESASTFHISSQSQMLQVLDFKTTRIREFVQHAKSYGVNLIVSADSLSEAALHECRKEGISVIHLVSEDEIAYIAEVAQIQMVYGPDGVISDSSIGTAVCCNSIMIGSSKCVNLGIDAKHFFVCSPTKGVCRQWYVALRNALKCLMMWLDHEHVIKSDKFDHSVVGDKDKDYHQGKDPHLVNTASTSRSCTNDSVTTEKDREDQTKVNHLQGICIQSGGAFEFLISKTLSDFSLCSSTLPTMSKSCKLIANAILCIPRFLNANSFMTKRAKTTFIHAQNEIKAKLEAEDTLHGIDGRTGKVSELSGQGVMEPVLAKYLLLCDVVKTVQELLRIDAVVGVQGSVKGIVDDNV